MAVSEEMKGGSQVRESMEREREGRGRRVGDREREEEGRERGREGGSEGGREEEGREVRAGQKRQ